MHAHMDTHQHMHIYAHVYSLDPPMMLFTKILILLNGIQVDEGHYTPTPQISAHGKLHLLSYPLLGKYQGFTN